MSMSYLASVRSLAENDQGRPSHPQEVRPPCFACGDGPKFVIHCETDGADDAARSDWDSRAVPIIVLAADARDRDRIFRALTTHLETLLARTSATNGGPIEIGELRIDQDARRVTVGGQPVALTGLEYRLLVTLAVRRDRVQDRGALLADVWGVRSNTATRTVDTHIKRLRGKLLGAGRMIESVRGVGYRLNDATPRASSAAPLEPSHSAHSLLG
jgi:DNA-binding winged helix-turn-helix (wHTH) protein